MTRRVNERLKTSKPSIEYNKPFIDYANAFKEAKEENYELYESGINDYESYVKLLSENARGINVEAGWVPQHTFGMINKSKVLVGIIRIRASIETESLRMAIGHIGYDIKPTERRKNYGTTILTLGLDEARKNGLKEVLVTCDRRNIASKKIIEINNGCYESDYYVEETGIYKSRYWIYL